MRHSVGGRMIFSESPQLFWIMRCGKTSTRWLEREDASASQPASRIRFIIIA